MLLLAQADPISQPYDGWWIGLGIGFAIVVVVVVLVAAILTYASRIADQALSGIELMDEARAGTLSVWRLQQTNVSVTGIWKAAESVRGILAGMR